MAAVIERIEPGRGVAGTTITITGSGFGASLPANGVEVDGLYAPLISADDEEVVAVVPPGIGTDKHLDVVLTNLTDATADTHRWWSKRLSGFATLRLPGALHGRDEAALDQTDEDNRVVMARTWNRMLVLLELLPVDIFTAKGVVAARGANGVVPVAPGTAGQRYTRDSATGGSWRTRQVLSLVWGRGLQAAETTEQFMCAGGLDTVAASNGEGHAAPFACRLGFLQVAVRRATAGGDLLTRIRVLKNGAQVYDTNDLALADRPALTTGSVFVAYPWASLAAGDRVTIGITKVGSSSELDTQAIAVMV